MSAASRTSATLLVLCVLASGCSMFDGGSSAPAKTSTAAVGSMRDTSTQLARVDAALTRSVNSLNGLSTSTDLKDAFKEFVNSSEALQRSGEVAKSRWKDMRTRGDAYLKSWQKELSQVTDEQLRSSMEARQQALGQNYEKIAETARSTQAAYEPYVRDLNEIERVLRFDLTPAGVSAIKPTLERASEDAAVFSAKLTELRRQLNEVMGEMPAAK